MAKLCIPSLLLFIFLVSLNINISYAKTSYNVLTYGARPNGKTDSTQAFLDAWTAACGSTDPTMIYIPKGSIGSLAKTMDEPGVLNVTVKSTIFTGTTNGFRIKSWARHSTGFVQAIRFIGATMINVQNPIIIDQNYCPHNLNCPNQVSGIQISDVMYQGIRGTSATPVAIKFDCSFKYPCKGITLQNVNLTYFNKEAQSTCTNAIGKISGQVQPDNCLNGHRRLDYFTVKTTETRRPLNINISSAKTSYNVLTYGARPNGKTDSTQAFLDAWTAACGSTAPTMIYIPKGSIGSLAKTMDEPGVQNVTVKSTVFTGTTNGFRIKSWARHSTGFVQAIRFIGATMINVQNPIIIDQNYCPHNLNCPNQVSGIQISDVMYQGIRGTSATPVAIKFDCSFKYPCKGITLQNVNLTYFNKEAQSTCTNAIGKISGQVSGIQISDVIYQGIRGTSATPVAIKFDCSFKYPCKGITLQNVNLTYFNKEAQSTCTNAIGKIYGQVQPDNYLLVAQSATN
ncbi:hypothetical protein NC651_025128 [Populus alba x Populus x berolinensis]|nr:hypothetical protein NC651_025128 [Populus alba x Populus x berolinensis]